MERTESNLKYLFFMRHGERSDWSGDAVIRKGDTTLTEDGHKQAYLTGEYIKAFMEEKGLKNLKVFSSPLVRAIQTSKEASNALGNERITIHNGV